MYQTKRMSKAFKDTYENCIVDTIMHLANESSYRLNDKISMIFARHRDFSLSRIEKYFGFMNYGDARLGTVGTDTPENLCQLQAADIIGYEVSRMERDDGTAERYPLRRLKELGCKFRIRYRLSLVGPPSGGRPGCACRRARPAPCTRTLPRHREGRT